MMKLMMMVMMMDSLSGFFAFSPIESSAIEAASSHSLLSCKPERDPQTLTPRDTLIIVLRNLHFYCHIMKKGNGHHI